jgi:hypothetical protein
VVGVETCPWERGVEALDPPPPEEFGTFLTFFFPR